MHERIVLQFVCERCQADETVQVQVRFVVWMIGKEARHGYVEVQAVIFDDVGEGEGRLSEVQRNVQEFPSYFPFWSLSHL